jgi:hypothetical protein
MGTGRAVTKYYRRNYYATRSTKRIQNDNSAMIILLIIAGPFTFGFSWLGLLLLFLTEY